MIKYYCDVCGKELRENEIKKNIEVTVGRLMFECLTGLDGFWNAGHFCHKCILEAVIKTLKDET